jgi:hypothetical protein
MAPSPAAAAFTCTGGVALDKNEGVVKHRDLLSSACGTAWLPERRWRTKTLEIAR